MCSVEGMILWTGSITITRKFHFRPSSSYKKSPWKLRGNYHECVCVCGTELHAPEIILHSLRPLSFPFFFCLWITFNLQSKQLWQGLWSFDGRQKEAVGEWVWGNEAAMSRNDLWAFPSCSFSPHTETQSVQISHYREIQFRPRTKWSSRHFKRLRGIVCLIWYSEPPSDTSAKFPHNSGGMCIRGNIGLKITLLNPISSFPLLGCCFVELF